MYGGGFFRTFLCPILAISCLLHASILAANVGGDEQQELGEVPGRVGSRTPRSPPPEGGLELQPAGTEEVVSEQDGESVDDLLASVEQMHIGGAEANEEGQGEEATDSRGGVETDTDDPGSEGEIETGVPGQYEIVPAVGRHDLYQQVRFLAGALAGPVRIVPIESAPGLHAVVLPVAGDPGLYEIQVVRLKMAMTPVGTLLFCKLVGSGQCRIIPTADGFDVQTVIALFSGSGLQEGHELLTNGPGPHGGIESISSGSGSLRGSEPATGGVLLWMTMLISKLIILFFSWLEEAD